VLAVSATYLGMLHATQLEQTVEPDLAVHSQRFVDDDAGSSPTSLAAADIVDAVREAGSEVLV